MPFIKFSCRVAKKTTNKFYQGELTMITLSMILTGIALKHEKVGPTFSSFNPCKQGAFWSIWNWWILRSSRRLGLSCVELHHGTPYGDAIGSSFLSITSKWRIFPMCLLIYNHLYLCNSSLDLNIQPQLEPGVVLPWHDETFRSGLSRPEVLRHSDRKKDQRPWKSLKR